MTTNDIKEASQNVNLPTPSNDNQTERYLSLDLENLSIDAQAFIEELIYDLQQSSLNPCRYRSEVRLAIEAIVADLFATAETGRERYAYRPLATGSFTDGHVGHLSFKTALEALATAGMVEVVPGKKRWSTGPAEKGVATRIRATTRLHETALGYGVAAATWATHFHQKPRLTKIRHPILLRSSSKMCKGRKLPGKAVPFVRTLRVREMEEQVNDLNAFNAKQDLNLGEYQHRHFYRVFGMGDYPGHNWKKGGRLYSPGLDSYQQAPSEERRAFLFNGEATIEIDIGSSFLTIYRVLSDIEFDRNLDPYDIPGLRRFASKSWVVMTFGHDKHHSRWPADTVRKYKDKFEDGEEGDWGTGNLQRDHPFAETQRLMLKALPELVAWPKSQIRWGDLQYAESCAVIDAVWTLAIEHGVVALPVHDSIRVPASKQELAKQVLSDAFRKQVGVAPVLKVK